MSKNNYNTITKCQILSLKIYERGFSSLDIIKYIVNNLILENQVDLLSIIFYIDINAIVITVGLTLFISYLAIAFFLGITQLGHREILMHIVRIGVVFTILNSSTGWYYYNDYFVTFFWEGSQELAAEVMSAVNYTIVDHIIH